MIVSVKSRFGEQADHALKYLGSAVFAASVVGFLVAKPKVDAINSLNGQLAISLSGLSGSAQDIKSQIQTYQSMYNLSLIGMVVGGLMIVVGFIRDSQK